MILLIDAADIGIVVGGRKGLQRHDRKLVEGGRTTPEGIERHRPRLLRRQQVGNFADKGNLICSHSPRVIDSASGSV